MELTIQNISKTYNEKRILDTISFSMSNHERICLIGESGCGKTTLLNIITGMLTPDSGTILLNNKVISPAMFFKLRNQMIGYLPCGNSLIPSLSIYDNILYAASLYPVNKTFHDVIPTYIDDILQQLHIHEIRNSFPDKISSGEYKRACFGRVMALETPFLILDEPTSNLDHDSADCLIQILDAMERHKGILIATHDDRLMGERVIEL